MEKGGGDWGDILKNSQIGGEGGKGIWVKIRLKGQKRSKNCICILFVPN